MEVRSVLASQNFDMHENLHFIGEDLSIESFIKKLNLAEKQIWKDAENFKEILEVFIENLEQNGNFGESEKFEKFKKFENLENLKNLENSQNSKILENFENLEISKNFENLENSKIFGKLENLENFKNFKFENFPKINQILLNSLITNLSKIHENFETFHEQNLKNYFQNFQTSPKMMRKVKLFMKKLSKVQNLILEKSENLIKNFKISQNDKNEFKEFFLNFSHPVDTNIRFGEKRNFVKNLEEMFEKSNSEIYKSKTFMKLLREQKISIPLACDVKCWKKK